MQATVHRFDDTLGTGSVVTDDGLIIPFGVEAFLASGLRHLRLGQRLTVRVSADGEAPGEVAAGSPRVLEMNLGTVGVVPTL